MMHLDVMSETSASESTVKSFEALENGDTEEKRKLTF